MALYVLDTDHVSMWLEEHPIVCQNIKDHRSDLVITIVMVQEVFNGWIGRLNHPSETNRQVSLYAKMSGIGKSESVYSQKSSPERYENCFNCISEWCDRCDP